LPAAGWGEKEGTVTNSERRISRQRSFMPAAGESKPDWWIVTQIAQRMGYAEAFPYTNPAQIFREHARLSGFENSGNRVFDIGAWSELSDEEYDALTPTQWPVTQIPPSAKECQGGAGHDAPAPGKQIPPFAKGGQGGFTGTVRLFCDGKFYTPSGRARMVAVAPRLPAVPTDDEFPLVLNTGRIRDQWHTMTRTGKVPRLNAHSYEPYVQVHSSDAQQLQNGGLARLTSRHGTMLARVQVSEDQRPGSVFVPMHWNDVFAKAARVDALVAPITDPISGQPESKHTPVRVEPYQPAWQGFVLSRERLDMADASYCACTQGAGYWRHEIAGETTPDDWRGWVQTALQLLSPARGKGGMGVEPGDGVDFTPSLALPLQRGGSNAENSCQWLEYRDAAMGRYRAACIQAGRLEAVFFIAPDQRLPEREWLASLFGPSVLEPADLAGLLAARPPKGAAADTGRIVCACFSVGEKTISNAIKNQGLQSVEAVGQCLKAGTNCGSCVPEIRRLLERH